MRKNIAIIGCGTAGIHLAYEMLSTSYFDITIYTREKAGDVRNGRVRSTQAHFSPTIDRERRYGMCEWSEAPKLNHIHISVDGKMLFSGKLNNDAQSVDQRLYFSKCMEDLEEKGVHFIYQKVTAELLPELVDTFDLVVDCTGRTSPVAPFQVNSSFTQQPAPLRKCHVGYFNGIRYADPLAITSHSISGAGDLYEIPALTGHGPVTILFVEAVPNGKLDVFNRVHHANQFEPAMFELIDSCFPEIKKRMELEKFQLCDKRAFFRIAILPKVHFPYCLINNKLVVGCGDSVILNDPITGQGDNTASFMAEQLFLSLMEDLNLGWGEKTGEKYWERSRSYVTHVYQWTHAMMQPLPDHIQTLFGRAAEDQTVANRIAGWFEHPATAYHDFF